MGYIYNNVTCCMFPTLLSNYRIISVMTGYSFTTVMIQLHHFLDAERNGVNLHPRQSFHQIIPFSSNFILM